METSKQATEAKESQKKKGKMARRLKWDWAEASIWTDAMLTALENGVKVYTCLESRWTIPLDENLFPLSFLANKFAM